MLRNRRDAGYKLFEALQYINGDDVVVMALPRGGVVVGAEIAKLLNTPLGVIIVRKLSYPYSKEYAVGAMTDGREPVYNNNEIYVLDGRWLKDAEKDARKTIAYRRKFYYEDGGQEPKIKDKTVVVVDDGMATGLSMEAAISWLLGKHPRKVIVAVPVASIESIRRIEAMVDSLVVYEDPTSFIGTVGAHYQEFDQVDDIDVKKIINDTNGGINQDIANQERFLAY